MNRAILMGRLTRDPDIRYTQGDNAMCIARYTLAVDRRRRPSDNGGNANQQTADFISCVAFGKTAEFVEKYLKKGTKICVEGRIQTGSYTNKDGQKVYTTEVRVESHDFAESRAASGQQTNAGSATGAQNTAPAQRPAGNTQSNSADPLDGFMNLPDGIDEELPFT